MCDDIDHYNTFMDKVDYNVMYKHYQSFTLVAIFQAEEAVATRIDATYQGQ